MAVYQGARPRPAFGLPLILRPGRGAGLGRDGERPAAPATRRAHGRRVARRGSVGLRRPTAPRVGLVLAGIVIAFSGGFVWLTQSVRVAATSYDIVRLVSERDRLAALRADLLSDLERLSGAPAIRQEAFGLGYGQLGAPLVIPAR